MLHFIHSKAFLQKPDPVKNLQIFDLLQLSKKERECREQYLRTKKYFDRWKKTSCQPSNSDLFFYRKIEGFLLKRQVQDAILFYKIVKNDRLRAFDYYIKKLPSRSSVFGVAS